MRKHFFLNTVYRFYPKGIDFIKERGKYTDSNEFNLLISTLNNFQTVNEKKTNELKNEISRNLIIENLEDVSSLTLDRCLTFDMDILDESEKKLYKLRLVISAIIPTFFVYVLEIDINLNPYRWLTEPYRNTFLEKEKFKAEINLIINIVKRIYNYDLFPEEYIESVIPDVSFTDIKNEEFTFFNAFFRGEKLN